ncbi:MAG: hypothetical protein HY965_06220, partial [Ignavibacteriales bacterium]|nr:hypothetical protein [Ignavibacteriales bacterium]
MRGNVTRLFLVLLILIISGMSQAQIKYSFSASSGNVFDSLSATTAFTKWTVVGTSQPRDESYSSAADIGFNFTYNDVVYTQLQATTNGFLRLGSNLAAAGTTNDLDGLTRRVLAPYWDDLAVDSAVFDINYQLTGTTPNRIFIVEWKNAHLNYAQVNNRYRFQVKLYETSNLVQFVYGGGAYTGASVTTASIGLSNEETVLTTANGTGTFISVSKADSVGSSFLYSNCWEFTGNTYFPDSGTVMTFSPVTPSAIAGGTYTVGSGGTYPTLSAAANALNVNGIAGAVVLEVLTGTYNDIFHLINVAGTSATNTITLRKNSGTVTLSPKYGAGTGNTSTTADAMIRLEGTQFVTIDGLNFFENAANWTTTKKFEVAVYLVNSMKLTLENGPVAQGARFNTLKNLAIDMNALSGTPNSNAIGIRFGTNSTNSDSSVANSYNTIQDCDIQDVWRAAIYMYGFSGALPNRGNKITAVLGRNAFHDISITAGASLDCRVIEVNAEADFTIENTDIYNVTNTVNTTNGVWGIRINPAAGTDDAAGIVTVRNNKIYNLSMPQTIVTSGFAAGLEANVVRVGTIYNIYNNQIYNISTNGSTTCRALGMQLNLANANGPATLNLYNNLIYDLRAPRSTGVPGVRGIDLQAGSSYLTANVYNNTVFIDSVYTVAVANTQSACIYLANFGTSSLDLRNNILVNLHPSGVSGKSPVLFASANSNLVRLAPTSNNNLYYVGVTPSTVKPIVWDAATSYTTMAAYQAALATAGLGGPREQSSVYEMPPFVDAASPYNVHLNTAVATLAESGGQPIAAVTSDFEGDLRNSSTPDIGADEFAGTVGTDNIAPVMYYTALANTNTTANRTLTVTLTDASGIGSGANLPRLYYKKLSDASWIFDATPSVSGNAYTFTFDHTALGGVVVGDTVKYFVAAQDLAGTPNLTVNPAGAASGTTPPGATLLDSTKCRIYSIINPALSGTYTVGISSFEKITGIKLEHRAVKKMVKQYIPVERFYTPPAPEKVGEMFAYTDPTVPGNLFDYAIDETKYEPYQVVETEVEVDATELVANGAPYKGPSFVSVNKDML